MPNGTLGDLASFRVGVDRVEPAFRLASKIAVPLERFHNRCIRVVRAERRFSAAFAAAKHPAQAAEVDDLSGLSDFLFLPYTRA